jgi:hypothetical protein
MRRFCLATSFPQETIQPPLKTHSKKEMFGRPFRQIEIYYPRLFYGSSSITTLKSMMIFSKSLNAIPASMYTFINIVVAESLRKQSYNYNKVRFSKNVKILLQP